MGGTAAYRAALQALPTGEWTAYLDAHSGLPGPRGNLKLLAAAGDLGAADWLTALAADGDEYRACVGTAGLGRLLTEVGGRRAARLAERLHALAGDDRWRVREGVAMALQRLGDTDPDRMWTLARDWAADPDPLVQRAAAAGVCEPRLLRHPAAAAAAVQLCEQVTATLLTRPTDTRRDPAVRTLRQALGYCWSVAVAADPAAGVPGWQRLARRAATADADPDLVWIVRENGRKARLAKALTAAGTDR